MHSFCTKTSKSILLSTETKSSENLFVQGPWWWWFVKWSACFPFTPAIRVRILPKSTFLVKLYLKRTKINKNWRGWPIIEQHFNSNFKPKIC